MAFVNSGPGVAGPSKEDSAHAIFLLIVASNSATRKERKGFESHFLPWAKARTFSGDLPNSADPLHQSMRLRRVMNPFVSEFFGCAIMRRLGIRTPDEQIICTPAKARALSGDFIVKVVHREGTAQSLTWNPTGAATSLWCLASRRVPNAASVDFVSRTIITSHSARAQFLQTCARAYQTFEELTAQTLGKTCESADNFFADFKPTESEIELIKRSMALDGSAYLRICAARVFIGSSAPHFGNVLVTKAGELISIDHARGYFEKGDDLSELFYFVDRCSEAFTVLAGVNGLTEKDIRESVSEIPHHSACGSTAGLADYYCTRLKLWKQYFEKEMSRSSKMELDPRLTVFNPLGAFGERLMAEAGALWRM
jgi:hypothetical protein